MNLKAAFVIPTLLIFSPACKSAHGGNSSLLEDPSNVRESCSDTSKRLAFSGNPPDDYSIEYWNDNVVLVGSYAFGVTLVDPMNRLSSSCTVDWQMHLRLAPATRYNVASLWVDCVRAAAEAARKLFAVETKNAAPLNGEMIEVGQDSLGTSWSIQFIDGKGATKQYPIKVVTGDWDAQLPGYRCSVE